MRNTLRVLLSIMYRSKGYDHVNIHVWYMSGFSSRFLGPRAAGMVAGRILSGSGRVRGAPDRWSCFGRAACRGAGPAAAAEAGGA
jgi:hypothetical protein